MLGDDEGKEKGEESEQEQFEPVSDTRYIWRIDTRTKGIEEEVEAIKKDVKDLRVDVNDALGLLKQIAADLAELKGPKKRGRPPKVKVEEQAGGTFNAQMTEALKKMANAQNVAFGMSQQPMMNPMQCMQAMGMCNMMPGMFNMI